MSEELYEELGGGMEDIYEDLPDSAYDETPISPPPLPTAPIPSISSPAHKTQAPGPPLPTAPIPSISSPAHKTQAPGPPLPNRAASTMLTSKTQTLPHPASNQKLAQKSGQKPAKPDKSSTIKPGKPGRGAPPPKQKAGGGGGGIDISEIMKKARQRSGSSSAIMDLEIKIDQKKETDSHVAPWANQLRKRAPVPDEADSTPSWVKRKSPTEQESEKESDVPEFIRKRKEIQAMQEKDDSDSSQSPPIARRPPVAAKPQPQIPNGNRPDQNRTPSPALGDEKKPAWKQQWDRQQHLAKAAQKEDKPAVGPRLAPRPGKPATEPPPPSPRKPRPVPTPRMVSNQDMIPPEPSGPPEENSSPSATPSVMAKTKMFSDAAKPPPPAPLPKVTAKPAPLPKVTAKPAPLPKVAARSPPQTAPPPPSGAPPHQTTPPSVHRQVEKNSPTPPPVPTRDSSILHATTSETAISSTPPPPPNRKSSQPAPPMSNPPSSKPPLPAHRVPSPIAEDVRPPPPTMRPPLKILPPRLDMPPPPTSPPPPPSSVPPMPPPPTSPPPSSTGGGPPVFPERNFPKPPPPSPPSSRQPPPIPRGPVTHAQPTPPTGSVLKFRRRPLQSVDFSNPPPLPSRNTKPKRFPAPPPQVTPEEDGPEEIYEDTLGAMETEQAVPVEDGPEALYDDISLHQFAPPPPRPLVSAPPSDTFPPLPLGHPPTSRPPPIEVVSPEVNYEVDPSLNQNGFSHDEPQDLYEDLNPDDSYRSPPPSTFPSTSSLLPPSTFPSSTSLLPPSPSQNSLNTPSQSPTLERKQKLTKEQKKLAKEEEKKKKEKEKEEKRREEIKAKNRQKGLKTYKEFKLPNDVKSLFAVEILDDHPKGKDHLPVSKGETCFVLLINHPKLPDERYFVEKEDGTMGYVSKTISQRTAYQSVPISAGPPPPVTAELDFIDQDIYEQLPQGGEDDAHGIAPPALPPPNMGAPLPPRFPAPSQPPPPNMGAPLPPRFPAPSQPPPPPPPADEPQDTYEYLPDDMGSY